jgi:transcriptional regulator with XRE-family HTH domain
MPLAFIFELCIFGNMVTKTQVKRTREKLGESQAEYAKHFKVNQSTIHRWETGKLPIEGIVEIGVEAVLARLAYTFVERQAAE